MSTGVFCVSGSLFTLTSSPFISRAVSPSHRQEYVRLKAATATVAVAQAANANNVIIPGGEAAVAAIGGLRARRAAGRNPMPPLAANVAAPPAVPAPANQDTDGAGAGAGGGGATNPLSHVAANGGGAGEGGGEQVPEERQVEFPTSSSPSKSLAPDSASTTLDSASNDVLVDVGESNLKAVPPKHDQGGVCDRGNELGDAAQETGTRMAVTVIPDHTLKPCGGGMVPKSWVPLEVRLVPTEAFFLRSKRVANEARVGVSVAFHKAVLAMHATGPVDFGAYLATVNACLHTLSRALPTESRATL